MNTDRPINRLEDDQFDRGSLADLIAQDLARGIASDGFVAAIVGPWGSGKTSLLNLVRKQLSGTKNLVLVDFNPWYYSETEQLVQHFFAEFASQLAGRKDKALRSLANHLRTYADILEPLAGLPVVGEVTGVAAKATTLGANVAAMGAGFGNRSLLDERAAITKALRESGRRFVVVIDDIDRVEPEGVRDLVRLVRLVADFPQTSYLLAFDRHAVEEALGRGDKTLGRDYLEKIVQTIYPIPSPDRNLLRQFLFSTLDGALEGAPARELDRRYWTNVATFVVEPLIDTPRDVQRYANGVSSAASAVGSEVNLVDLLALEAVRVLLPDTFEQLPRLVDVLTHVDPGVVGLGGTEEASEAHQALASLIASGGDKQEAVRQLLHWVFPGSRAYLDKTHFGAEWARGWRRERRVAHRDVFEVYLARMMPAASLPTSTVEAAFDALTDAARLRRLLEELSDEFLEPLLDRLQDFADTYPADCLEAVVALQNLLPRLPSGRRAMLDPGAEIRLQRVIRSLLLRVDDEARREATVEAAFARIGTLSAKFWLLLLVGHRKDAGLELVSHATDDRLLDRLRDEIRSASADELASERDLIRLLDLVREGVDAGQQPMSSIVLEDNGVLVAALRSAVSEARSQTIGEVSVQSQPILPWDFLQSLFATSDLSQRVRDLGTLPPRFASDDRTALAVDIARRYAAGWRPEGYPRGQVPPDADGEPAPPAGGSAGAPSGLDDS